LLHLPDDLELLGSGISCSASPPSPSMLFLSRRFSRARSIAASFSAEASCRRSLTSGPVAWRAVSPASRLLLAPRKNIRVPTPPVGARVTLRLHPCDFKALDHPLRTNNFVDYAQRFSRSDFNPHPLLVVPHPF